MSDTIETEPRIAEPLAAFVAAITADGIRGDDVVTIRRQIEDALSLCGDEHESALEVWEDAASETERDGAATVAYLSLRAGIEALADEWEFGLGDTAPDPVGKVFAGPLRALLSTDDEKAGA